jgi:hypothetical protein
MLQLAPGGIVPGRGKPRKLKHAPPIGRIATTVYS